MNSFDDDNGFPAADDTGKKQDGKGRDVAGNVNHFPSQKELEKEVGEYLARKYGGRVRVVSQMVVPGRLDADGESGQEKREGKGSSIEFDMKPEELEQWLDRFVVRQDRAKAVLATKICTHFRRIAYLKNKKSSAQPVGNIKNNVILVGPTGVGKTYLVKLVASRLGVPFVKGDATKFSETGYVGGDVEDLVRDLVKKAGGDIEKASCGIVYIDEIDKIASTRGIHGPDVSRAGVQRALLKLLEETDVEIKPAHDPISQIEAIERYRKTGKREADSINTKNILFIVSGAFSGLAEIIRKRQSRNGMGFGADVSTTDEHDWLRDITPQDLVEFGFENEFVGRLPVTAVLDPLSEDDLYEILRNPESVVITSKKQDFRAYGIDIRFEDSALRLLASHAFREQTGARALVSVLERVLLPFEKKLPSLDVEHFVLTEEMVRDCEGELEKFVANPYRAEFITRYETVLRQDEERLAERLAVELPSVWEKRGMELNDFRISLIARMCTREDLEIEDASSRVLFWIKQIRSYQDSFYRKHGMTIVYDEGAVDRLLDSCRYDETGLYARCERLNNIFEYGLSVVRKNSGRDTFFIDADAVENPEGFVNSMIRESYREQGLDS